MDERVVTLFRFDLAIAGGIGAAFSFLASQKVAFNAGGYCLFGLAILSLLVSGVCLLLAFDPKEHLYPVEEETGLLLINRLDSDQDGRANMALALTASTEIERQAGNSKGKWMRIGLGAELFSVILFIFGLFSLIL